VSKNALVKVDDCAVAGIQVHRFAVNGGLIDLDEPWSGTVRRASLAGRGHFKDSLADSFMRQNFFDGAIRRYEIFVPTFGVIRGPFQISNLEFAGADDGEITYDIALESAGEVTLTEAH